MGTHLDGDELVAGGQRYSAGDTVTGGGGEVSVTEELLDAVGAQSAEVLLSCVGEGGRVLAVQTIG